MSGRPASRGKGKGNRGPGKRLVPPPSRQDDKPAGEQMVAVRMLVGPSAGRTVAVPHSEAVRLCGGWTPQAELVARNAASLRETR